MGYFYDISLNFNDYPIQCYDWDIQDNIERVLKVKLIRVVSVEDFISYECSVELENDIYLLSDTINAIAIEVINNKIAYISYLKYNDEINVCKAANKLEIYNIKYMKLNRRIVMNELREDIKIKKEMLDLVNESNDNLLKYIYYDITNEYSANIEKIKLFLINDILNNFNQKYVNLYQNICK